MKNPVVKIRLNKNDTVVVRSGKYKGQTGKIVAVHPHDNTVTVEGINIVKKHQKPNTKYPQGGIIELTKPIAVSKVGLAVKKTDKGKMQPSRIGFKLDKDGKKTRIAKLTGKEIR